MADRLAFFPMSFAAPGRDAPSARHRPRFAARIVFDGLIVTLLGLLCRSLNPEGHAGHTVRELLVVVVTAGLVAMLLRQRGGRHPKLSGGRWRQMAAALSGVARGFALVLLCLLLWDGATAAMASGAGTVLANRNWLAAWTLSSLLLLPLLHGLPWRTVVEAPRRAIVIGGGAHARHLAVHLAEAREAPLLVTGFLAMSGVAAGLPRWPHLRDLTEVVAAIRREEADLVILALPGTASRRIEDLLRRMSDLPIDIRLAPDLTGFQYRDARISSLAGLSFLHLRDRPIAGTAATAKRLLDLLLAALLLALLGLPMLGLALAIRLDSRGPALFVQPRLGFNHRVIRVLKFRSMRMGAGDGAGRQQARRGDPRVTRLGAWLRRTSLDELPQLLNVLAGDMSLVGPRPHALGTEAAGQPFDQAVADYAARHRVKPGMTGWAQIHGLRGETDTVEKLRQRVTHDLHYIDHWSLALDLRILALTLAALWRGGAY